MVHFRLCLKIRGIVGIVVGGGGIGIGIGIGIIMGGIGGGIITVRVSDHRNIKKSVIFVNKTNIMTTQYIWFYY